MERKLPAYPLWVIDPDFSIWSKSDTLNGTDAIFWQGTSRRTYGFVRFGGKTYCFLGRRDDAVPLVQKDVAVGAFETVYTFACAEFALKVRFLSPLLPNDLAVLSRPVCYTRYEVRAKGALPEDFSVALVLDEEYCYSAKRAPVIGGVLPCKSYEAAFMTRRRNLVASDTSDTYAADHGYTYLAGEESFFVTEAAVNRYVAEGKAEYLRASNERACIMSVSRAPAGYFMTAHDDLVSVFYFGEWLKGYYFRDGKTIVDAMDDAHDGAEKVFRACKAFDKKLKADCDAVGEGYYALACAALRQSVGGHKLVQNAKGELLFLSKECDSNGCIGTADISYPSMPLFLIYNPELVNAMMRGICTFARMPVWTFAFAPHDLGTYPWCSGQVYGVRGEDDKFNCGMLAFGWGEGPKTQPMLYLRPAASSIYDEKMQMPVEECGNMLIMTAAAIRAGAGTAFAAQNIDLLRQWAHYLRECGLHPGNQLCTDDFAGHLAGNVNLAIKAVVGIGCFAVILRALGKETEASEYADAAASYAAALRSETGEGVLPLAYGQEGTYSLKYNLLFDRLLGLGLFGREICERETEYYLARSNRFGVPLDTRENYTKSDWILWCAALTEDKEKAERLYAPVVRFLKESPVRLPFGDWYRTEKGEIVHFINRTVQGGVFAPLLSACGKLKQQ